MENAKQLGFNYVYHYNDLNGKWYCIHRDSLLNYWSKTMKDCNNWVEGETQEDAAAKMILCLEKA